MSRRFGKRSGLLAALGLAVTLGPGCRDGGDGDDDDGGAQDGGSTGAADAGDADDGAPADDDGGGDGGDIAYLSPTDHLVRASMALRGIRPSVEHLRAVDEDPDQLDRFVDEYLESTEFGVTVRDLHNEAWLLRADPRPDLFYFPALSSLGLDASVTDFEISQAVWEQPLRLVEHVVMNDLPYSEIVTADYTVVNAVTSQIWGLGYDGDGSSWELSEWGPQRPAAGLLSESAIFNRFKSMPSNANRARANAVSVALLCQDFLSASIPIEGTIDLSDPDAVNDAVKNNPSCSGCHADLDPLASFLWGHNLFVVTGNTTVYPQQFYIPEQEPAWMFTTGTPPSFYGDDGDDLRDLGRSIADDPAFARCAARRFYSYLAQVPLHEVPADTVKDLDDFFVASGLNAKALAREIVLSDAFRVSHSNVEAGAGTVYGMQRARPRQLARAIEDLTGFVWAWSQPVNAAAASEYQPQDGQLALLENSFFGYEALAGGIDSYYVTVPSATSNPTASLVLQRLAALAAGYVVDRDLDRAPADRKLLGLVDGDGLTADNARLRAQFQELHLRLFGELVEPDSTQVDDTLELFGQALKPDGDARRAWKVTLTAMLQDLRIVHY